MKTAREKALQILEEVEHLMKLHGENPFKLRAFEKARVTIEGLPEAEDLKERARIGTLIELPGIGKGISDVLTEFLLSGTSKARDELKKALPEGLWELTQVPGLGPKKARQVIDELGITTWGELEYACRENRLAKLKGFGDKVQAKVLEGVQFLRATEGMQKISDAFPQAESLYEKLRIAANHGRKPAPVPGLRVVEAGALRRRLEVLAELDFLVELPEAQAAAAEVRKACEEAVQAAREAGAVRLPVKLHYSGHERFGYEWARLTGTPEHWQALGSPAAFDAPDEDAFFARLQLSVIPAEARETGEEVRLGREGKLQGLLGWDGVKGIFHNHTTRSDGANTVEEMVRAARDLGYRYIGISDHSQSAFYAQGLKVPDLLDQEREIREVQAKYPDIRVFWGIESDILEDGSLDYDEKVLKKFDFVVASIHSRFQMDRDTMTERILQAVRNPATRFLGHATGRLLLGRPGYACDLERIIRECAKFDVAIEINANPARLDVDWRWGPVLRDCGAQVAINPDAHEVAGLQDTRYGIAVARKALLPATQVVNAGSVEAVEKWLTRR